MADEYLLNPLLSSGLPGLPARRRCPQPLISRRGSLPVEAGSCQRGRNRTSLDDPRRAADMMARSSSVPDTCPAGICKTTLGNTPICGIRASLPAHRTSRRKFLPAGGYA